MKGEATLIVTLNIDEQSQAFFDHLRAAHFPAPINYPQAHITLFHRLPANTSSVTAIIRKYSHQTYFSILARKIQNTGNGNAYQLESGILQIIHHGMQTELAQWLIFRDKQPLNPHVTIQNKVTAYKALLLNRQLSENFKPFEITATGLSTWLYKNGPWEHIEYFPFK